MPVPGTSSLGDPKHTPSWDEPPDPAELRELARRLDAMAGKFSTIQHGIGTSFGISDGIGTSFGTPNWSGKGFQETHRAGVAVIGVLGKSRQAFVDFASSVRDLADEAEKAIAARRKAELLGIINVVLLFATLFLPLGRIISTLVEGLTWLLTNIATKIGTVMPTGAIVEIVFGQIAVLPVSLLLWGVPEVIASAATGDWTVDPLSLGLALGLGGIFGLPFFWKGPKISAGGTPGAGSGAASGQKPLTGSGTPSSVTLLKDGASPITTLENSGLGFLPKPLGQDGGLVTGRPFSRPFTPPPSMEAVDAATAQPVPTVRDGASAGGPGSVGETSVNAPAPLIIAPRPVAAPVDLGRGPSRASTPGSEISGPSPLVGSEGLSRPVSPLSLAPGGRSASPGILGPPPRELSGSGAGEPFTPPAARPEVQAPELPVGGRGAGPGFPGPGRGAGPGFGPPLRGSEFGAPPVLPGAGRGAGPGFAPPVHGSEFGAPPRFPGAGHGAEAGFAPPMRGSEFGAPPRFPGAGHGAGEGFVPPGRGAEIEAPRLPGVGEAFVPPLRGAEVPRLPGVGEAFVPPLRGAEVPQLPGAGHGAGVPPVRGVMPRFSEMREVPPAVREAPSGFGREERLTPPASRPGVEAPRLPGVGEGFAPPVRGAEVGGPRLSGAGHGVGEGFVRPEVPRLPGPGHGVGEGFVPAEAPRLPGAGHGAGVPPVRGTGMMPRLPGLRDAPPAMRGVPSGRGFGEDFAPPAGRTEVGTTQLPGEGHGAGVPPARGSGSAPPLPGARDLPPALRESPSGRGLEADFVPPQLEVPRLPGELDGGLVPRSASSGVVTRLPGDVHGGPPTRGPGGMMPRLPGGGRGEPPIVRQPPSGPGLEDDLSPSLEFGGRRQLDISLSPGEGLSELDGRLVGKLPAGGSVAIRDGQGSFPANSLSALRRSVWGEAEGELVVPADRVKGVPQDRSVVPTLRGAPVSAAHADEFRVYASGAAATSAHPTWLRPGGSSVPSVGEESVSTRQTFAAGPPLREAPLPPRTDQARFVEGPGPESSGQGILGGSGEAHLVNGPKWTLHADGWHRADSGGVLRLGDGAADGPGTVHLPPGSKAVFHHSGELRLVAFPDGRRFDRGLNGAWSKGRIGNYDFIVSKLNDPVEVPLAGGTTRTLRADFEFRDRETGQVLAYHIKHDPKSALYVSDNSFVRTFEGHFTVHDLELAKLERWLATPVSVRDVMEPVELPMAGGTTTHTLRAGHEIFDLRTGQTLAYETRRDLASSDPFNGHTFVRTTDGRFTAQDLHPSEIQAWLGAANGVPDVSRTLHYTAALYRAGRLSGLGDSELGALLRSPGLDDRKAAVYEVVLRHEGKAMRWNQAEAVEGYLKKGVANQASGDGKSVGYHAILGHFALHPDSVGTQMITPPGLVWREFEQIRELYKRYGFDIHRMNKDGDVPAAVPGRPTIYVGSGEHIGFSYLAGKPIPGRSGVLDELDELLVYDGTRFQISEGVDGLAPKRVGDRVVWARDFVTKGLTDGRLTEAHFGREPGQKGGPAALTGAGVAKVEEILGGRLSAEGLKRLNLEVTARWEYRENTHYALDEGKVVIINQVNHNVLKDLKATMERPGMETRWNGGLAQALEAKHNLPIRDDPKSQKSVTVAEIYTPENYDILVGASGTASGKEALFAAQGLSGRVRQIPRYLEPKLIVRDDLVFETIEEKLKGVAAHAAGVGRNGRPQWIIVDDNADVQTISNLLTRDKVAHEAVDVRWFLDKKAAGEDLFQKITDSGGKLGQITVVNRVGARGTDVPVGADEVKLGGLKVPLTARSALGHDIDRQGQDRGGRNGQPGEAQFYTSAEDDLFRLSPNPDVQLTITRYLQAAEVEHVRPTMWSAADLEVAKSDLSALAPGLQAEAAARLGITTEGVRPLSLDPVAGRATDTPPQPTNGVKTPQPSKPPAEGSTPALPDDVTRAAGFGPTDDAAHLAALRAAVPPGSGLQLRPLADQPGLALSRDGAPATLGPVRAASDLPFGNRTVLVLSPEVLGASGSGDLPRLLSGPLAEHRGTTLIDVGDGPRLGPDVIQGWADQGWTGPGGTAPIIVPAHRLLEVPNSDWFVPFTDVDAIGGRTRTAGQFASYFLVYPSNGLALNGTPHNLPPSAVAGQFELGANWILDTTSPLTAVVSPSRFGPLPVPPSGVRPGANRLEVIDAAMMPPTVQAAVHRLLVELPSTVELVVDGQRGDHVASWRAGLELAALQQAVPPGYQVRPAPAGYAIGRDAARLAELESARTLPPLADSSVIFLDPSIGDTAAATDIIGAARRTVTGRVVAHLNPSTPISPDRAGNTAAELRWRAGVPVLIGAGGLTAQPGTDRFVPVGRDDPAAGPAAGHYLILPPKPTSLPSVTSHSGSAVDTASVTDDTSETTPSPHGEKVPGQTGAMAPAVNPLPRSTIERLRVWRDHLQPKVDDELGALGPAAANAQAVWRGFSDMVDTAVRRITDPAADGADALAVGAELAAVVRAYVRTAEQLPTQLRFLPTVAQILGQAPPLTPLPETAGATGRFVTRTLGKAVNRLSLVPDADVQSVVLGWNRWVSSLGADADREEILAAATGRVTDVFLQAKPAAQQVSDADQVSVRNAVAYLAGRGRIDVALGYLAQPDPSRRRQIVRSAVAEADADVLKALGELSSGTAKLPSELADVNMIGALAKALGGGVDISHLPDNRAKARELGISRELIPRFLTDAKRVDWVAIVNQLIARNPDRADALRTVAIAALDC